MVQLARQNKSSAILFILFLKYRQPLEIRFNSTHSIIILMPFFSMVFGLLFFAMQTSFATFCLFVTTIAFFAYVFKRLSKDDPALVLDDDGVRILSSLIFTKPFFVKWSNIESYEYVIKEDDDEMRHFLYVKEKRKKHSEEIDIGVLEITPELVLDIFRKYASHHDILEFPAKKEESRKLIWP